MKVEQPTVQEIKRVLVDMSKPAFTASATGTKAVNSLRTAVKKAGKKMKGKKGVADEKAAVPTMVQRLLAMAAEAPHDSVNVHPAEDSQFGGASKPSI